MTLEEALPLVTAVTAAVGVVDWLIRKRIAVHRDEMVLSLNAQQAVLHTTVSTLTGERDKARADHAAAVQLQAATATELAAESQVSTGLRADLKVSDGQVAALSDLKDALDKNQKTHDNRINRALKLQGAIWTQPVMTGPPPFVPRAERKTPIVSVLNLKGGVGKTTVTANLAWALSDRGYRVLLIDLDLQGSLSSLFLHNEELARLGGKGEERLLQHYLSPAKPIKDGEKPIRRKLLDFAVPVPQLNPGCRLIAASDRLAYAELSQTVRWLLRVGGKAKAWSGRHDGRMILRSALHKKGLYKRFDVILMDCPPLLNLCCSNALAASDDVLIPVTPSPKAIERVSPLLRRVVEVRANGVNPELNVLGVVINRTAGRDLSPREKDLFVNLPDQCQAVFGTTVDRFDTIIQQRVAIQDTEGEFKAPDDGHPLRQTFEELAEEFIKRIGLGEPRKPACKKKGDAAAAGGTL